jgi:tetratricopeptide (TPR) repeat protein
MTRRSVMISSTARDLPKHRDEVRLACLRAGFDPREMMENLPALNKDATDASLRMVEEADVYLCILAYRYGTVPEGYEISITEMEFNRAVELNKPRLVFFIHKDHPVLGGDVETGSGATKLETLKARIGEHRVAAFFKSPEDLRAHAVEALTSLSKELDTAETGDAVASVVAQLHRRTSIPAPPEPYVAHPYTLLQTRDLVGRQTELNALTDWVADPAAPAFSARVFCFVAIGGMGKSALTWKWFNQIAQNEMKPLAGRLWWSFYESDASFENFLIRALCYVSRQGEDEARRLTWHDREAQLLRHLSEEPYLFVLDGLERMLIAYNRMDASYLADDDYDQQTANIVAGAIGLPPSAAQSFTGQHRLRRTSDPRAGAFLQKLAQIAKSRILITSRLYPNELQLPNGEARPGSFAYFLRGLSDDDALGLWRALGAAGSRVELVPIFHSIESHPLLVQALASEVANYRKAPGDFTQWRADHPNFDPTSLPLSESRTDILKFALNGLSTKDHKVLHTLVGFRMPASYASQEALLVGPGKVCGSAQELDRALTELEDRGLIGWDRAANRYDAHPIVRGVVWQLTDVGDRRAVYAALETHFEPMVTPEWEQVETLADLTPAIERYNTLVGLGRHDDAFSLFLDRLDNATHYRLAANQERIAWLERLFPEGVVRGPRLSKGLDQCDALVRLGGSYYFTGQPLQAVSLTRRAYDLAETLRHASYCQYLLPHLGDMLREIGALREAVGTLQQAVVMSHESEYRFEAGQSLHYLGLVLGATGTHPLARLALTRALHLCRQRRDPQLEGVANAFLAELALWIDDLVGRGTGPSGLVSSPPSVGMNGTSSVADFCRAVWRSASAIFLARMTVYTTLCRAPAPLMWSSLSCRR